MSYGFSIVAAIENQQAKHQSLQSISHSLPICSKIMNKQHIYERNIRRSLAEQYVRMEELLKDIPVDFSDLTNEQLEQVAYVESIEEEWCCDPELRKSISLIQWED